MYIVNNFLGRQLLKYLKVRLQSFYFLNVPLQTSYFGCRWVFIQLSFAFGVDRTNPIDLAVHRAATTLSTHAMEGKMLKSKPKDIQKLEALYIQVYKHLNVETVKCIRYVYYLVRYVILPATSSLITALIKHITTKAFTNKLTQLLEEFVECNVFSSDPLFVVFENRHIHVLP